jgi:hypothetical protein
MHDCVMHDLKLPKGQEYRHEVKGDEEGAKARCHQSKGLGMVM